MNIHVASAAGDAAEFAEISAEKSPLCENTRVHSCRTVCVRAWCRSPFPRLSLTSRPPTRVQMLKRAGMHSNPPTRFHAYAAARIFAFPP